jgi:hypothetical protein
MNGTDAPCRLHVYLARDAPVGVVLRRGPSAWTRLTLWHTDTDTFQHGQWIYGRVFERRSDLSAEGSLFIAFIRGNSARLRPDQRADSWIAISRPPYFTALALWWVGGTYCTGGLFADRRSVWTGWQNGPDRGRLPRWLKTVNALPHIDRTNNWTDRTVFHNRLLRDGWQPLADHTTWERRHPQQPDTLVFTELGWDARAFGGPHTVDYLLRGADGLVKHLPRVTWADFDQRGRLIVVQDGKLLDWRSQDTWVALADFNTQAPDPRVAPAWATRWPPRPA